MISFKSTQETSDNFFTPYALSTPARVISIEVAHPIRIL